MKVLFLDIDGVLNSHKHFNSEGAAVLAASIPARISRENVACLNEIVQRVPCVIVISSSWRLVHNRHEILAILQERGFEGAMILGSTPHKMSLRSRGAEIQFALDNMPEEVESFVIIDDDDDGMEDLADRLVRTDSAIGLTHNDVEKAVRILNKAC